MEVSSTAMSHTHTITDDFRSKHMDKHDRPYRCSDPECAKLPGFTYSGGLLRHEREVHNKHGGPKATLRCPHPDCKRHTGKGFTRRENLNEHVRRVHSDGKPSQSQSQSQSQGQGILPNISEVISNMSNVEAMGTPYYAETAQMTQDHMESELPMSKRARTEELQGEQDPALEVEGLRQQVQQLRHELSHAHSELHVRDQHIEALNQQIEDYKRQLLQAHNQNVS